MEDEKHRTILKEQAKMKTSFIRAFVLIFALIPNLYTSAADFESDGLYYNILSEGKRTVEVTYYLYDSKDNKDYVSGDIEIPRNVLYDKKTYTVTSIGRSAFYSCYNLKSVMIPSSVNIIGKDAFMSCTGLTSVTIPNSVTSIRGWAFNECTGLTSVKIPDSVITIGKCARSVNVLASRQ